MAETPNDITEISSAPAGAAVQTAENPAMEDVAAKKKPEPEKPGKKPNKFMQAIRAFNDLRQKNSERFKLLNLIMLIVFPIYITCMAEIIQAKKISVTASYFAGHPTVFLFDILIAGVIFVFLLALFRIPWLAVLIESFTYVALSIVELFKYNTNGNHLLLSDLRLAKNAKSLSSFAYIKITWQLVLCCIIAILIFLFIYCMNPKIKFKPLHRVATALGCIVFGLAMIIFPKFYNPVYKVFTRLGPSCVYGPCPEGRMSCGHPYKNAWEE